MPKSPWRCSQCGTVNEPSANSCRTCGRWPSLFDLQDNQVGEGVDDEVEAPTYEVEHYEPETVDVGGLPSPSGAEPTSAPTEPRRRSRSLARRLVRFVIPIGVLLYFLLSSYFSNH